MASEVSSRMARLSRSISERLATPVWRGRFLLLAIGALGLFLLRFAILRSFPFPPSGDAGGDLFGVHQWLGTAPPGEGAFPRLPPVYSLVVVAPALALFPAFTAIDVYSALVPALLIFPAYAFLRRSAMGPLWCGVGAFALAGSAAFSLMMTWNAAYNLFGIFLLLLFLATLPPALRNGDWSSVAVAAIAFGLLVGSHMLTALVGVVAAVATGAAFLLTSPMAWRPRLRHLGQVALGLAAASAPFFGLYYAFVATGTNFGLGAYASSLSAVYGSAWYFAWGVQGGPIPLFVLLDLVLAAVGMWGWLAWRREDPLYLGAVLGVSAGALAIPWIAASEAARALYYLPIPLVAAVVNTLDRWDREGLGTSVDRAVTRLRALAPRSRPRPIPRPGPRPWRHAAVVSLAIVVVGANLALAATVADQGAAFYQTLTPDRVAALNWVQSHTPPNATFFDGAGLFAWMWGYANRADYAPQPLTYQSTATSYANARLADLVNLGGFLAGDGAFVVAMDSPARVGTPSVYLTTPGGWLPLLSAQADGVYLWMDTAQGPREVTLGQATFLGATPFASANGTVGYRITYAWPGAGFQVNETEIVSGASVTLAWNSTGATLSAVSTTFSFPPSGYYLRYVMAPGANPNVTEAEFAVGSQPSFQVAFTGGSFSVSTDPTGWTHLAFRGRAFRLSSIDLPDSSAGAFTLDTAGVLAQLGIRYAIVDYQMDYPMYVRLEAGIPGELSSTLLARFGSIYLFEVRPP
jgi:hypothetical protein